MMRKFILALSIILFFIVSFEFFVFGYNIYAEDYIIKNYKDSEKISIYKSKLMNLPVRADYGYRIDYKITKTFKKNRFWMPSLISVDTVEKVLMEYSL